MKPDDWQSLALGDVAGFASGKTPSRSRQADYFDRGIVPWVKTMNLTNAGIFATDERVTRRAIRDVRLQVQPVGTVLVAMYGGFNQIGRTGVLRISAATNQAITAVLPNHKRINSDYLLHLLNYKVGYWRSVASSSRKDPNITKADVKAFPLSLPPLREQDAITAVINDADDLISALSALITKKQAIKQGMMQQLLTGRTRLPGFSEPWSATTLGTVGTFLKGRGVKRDDVRTIGIPCIRYGELYTAFSDYTAESSSFVTPEVAATALPLQSGDLLFTGSGETRDEIGKCVAYVGEIPAVAGGDLIVLRGTGFNSVYLALLANTPAVVNQKARAGQGDAVVHISSHALAAVQIDLPPRDEQDAIASVVLDADRELASLHQRLDKARDLKTGMMQQLLTGRSRLPVQEAAA